MSGYCYLLQPDELLGTKRYKVGRSSGNATLTRIKNGYKKNTEIFGVAACNNSVELEKKIIECFNEKFCLISGNEYFEGDIDTMKQCFFEMVSQNFDQTPAVNVPPVAPPRKYYTSSGQNNEYIITLEIPSDAQTNIKREHIVNSKYAHYRCASALVVHIECKKTKEKKDYVKINNNSNFVYKVGIVNKSSFDSKKAHGIRFFLTKEQALMYGTIPIIGEYKEWYENGQLWKECVYKDGKKEGEYKLWYRDGQLWEECVYKDGELEGEYKSWYENGRLQEECMYKDGEREGKYREWHKSGRLQEECVYKDGELEGEYKSWYDNGQLWTEWMYKDGELEGEYKSWYENGRLQEECVYKDGEIDGKYKKWNENGQFIEEIVPEEIVPEEIVHECIVCYHKFESEGDIYMNMHKCKSCKTVTCDDCHISLLWLCPVCDREAINRPIECIHCGTEKDLIEMYPGLCAYCDFCDLEREQICKQCEIIHTCNPDSLI